MYIMYIYINIRQRGDTVRPKGWEKTMAKGGM